MKVKALITLVVGKGTEIGPNQVADVSEAEAKRLIELGFAEELPKAVSSRSRNNSQSKANPIIPTSLDDEDDENAGEEPDEPDDESGEQPV